MVKLLPGEKRLLYVKKIKILSYKWISWSFRWWDMQAMVTNKRLVTIYGGWEYSYFFKKDDFKKYRKLNDCVIIKHSLGKSDLFGNFIKLVVKGRLPPSRNMGIYTDKSKEIEKIIKKYSN